MKVIEQVEVKMEWTDFGKWVAHSFPPPHPRSPGVHLSGVLRYVAIQTQILDVDPTTGKWRGDKDRPDDEFPLRMWMGMGWEHQAAGMYPEMVWQPGEFERDEVFGTPDGLTLLDPAWAVICRLSGEDAYPVMLEEFKLTWKSSFSGAITDQWMWMRQGMGYCALLQANGYDCRIVRYHVGYVNGDYRPPSPKYIRYTVEFSQKEIDGLWGLVLRNKGKEGVVWEK